MRRGLERVLVLSLGMWLAACGEPVREPCAGPCSAVPPSPPSGNPGTQDPAAPPPVAQEETPVEAPSAPTPSTASVLQCADLVLPALPVADDSADTDTCVPAVTTEEAIAEPAGGWDAAGTVLARYEAPEDAAPFGALEPAACVADARPRLDTWCEKREYHWSGALSALTVRTADGGTVSIDDCRCLLTRSCTQSLSGERHDAAGRLVARAGYDAYYGRYVRETWRWAADGQLAEYVENQDDYGHPLLTVWRLRRACDGRPSHFEITLPYEPQRVARFLYDASGRVTRDPTPTRGGRRAWDAQGRLRADERWTIAPGGSSTTADYYDAAGRTLATRWWHEGGMGTSEKWTWNELAPDGSVRASRSLWNHNETSWASSLTRRAYDAEGRPVLAWTTHKLTGSGASPTELREVERWTYVCGSSELAAYERDRETDGRVDDGYTWKWSPATRTITERPMSGGGWTEYRFDCRP